MGFEFLQKIPSVGEVLDRLPLDAELKKTKFKRDQDIVDVFLRTSDKFLVVIGPCSAHDEDAVCEYVSKLAVLQERVLEKIIIIPRIYTNKPRTLGVGYKGMAHQPKLHEEPDLVEGLSAIRKMHMRVLKESHLTAADEMLYPGNYPYLEDLLSYVTIGARSVENQQHRLTVSGLDIPVGMKNPTSGDLEVMLNSVHAAQTPHVFNYNGWAVKTDGNSLSHCILRGAVDHYGRNIPNYHYEDLVHFADSYLKRGFANPTIIVDTNHSNSNKTYKEQPRIALEILRSRQHCEKLKDLIRGLMVESYLAEGSQALTGAEFGRSVTDSCLGWESSERLVLEMADHV